MREPKILITMDEKKTDQFLNRLEEIVRRFEVAVQKVEHLANAHGGYVSPEDVQDTIRNFTITDEVPWTMIAYRDWIANQRGSGDR